MPSDGSDRSVGCRKCMKRAMQVLSEVLKPLMRFLGTCQALCADFTFPVTWVCLEAAVNHSKYNRISWHDREMSSGTQVSQGWCKLLPCRSSSFGVIFNGLFGFALKRKSCMGFAHQQLLMEDKKLQQPKLGIYCCGQFPVVFNGIRPLYF